MVKQVSLEGGEIIVAAAAGSDIVLIAQLSRCLIHTVMSQLL